MSERKLLTGLTKSELYDQLLNSIDQKFGAEVLTQLPTDPELVAVWFARVAGAINNRIISWRQLFALFPPDYAEAFKAELIRLDEKKD